MAQHGNLNIPASSLLDSENTNIFEEYGDGFVGKCLDNRYDIIGMLASGGMGDVYLARQRGVGQEVAVKKLHDKFYEDPQVVDRFIDEARSYARIIHPNAVKLHDLLNVRGQICIVMEYVHGKTLTTYIDRGYVFSIRQIVEIGMQLADVLGTVHNAGIIHRDLKAENIMLVETVGKRFSVKILDFGIAKILGKQQENTNFGMVVGSPQFMSPEQCYGYEVDARADIYAFGILLYLMICGKLPFNATRPKELMEMQCSAPVPKMHRPDSSEIPPSLESIVLKTLEKKADNRYASFAEVIADLTCFQEGKTLCVAESIDHQVSDVMAAIAAAENELASKQIDEIKEFALDDGHETTITNSPSMRLYNLKRKIREQREQSGVNEFSTGKFKFILILLILVVLTAVGLFFFVNLVQSENEIAIKQKDFVIEDVSKQASAKPATEQESPEAAAKAEESAAIDGEEIAETNEADAIDGEEIAETNEAVAIDGEEIAGINEAVAIDGEEIAENDSEEKNVEQTHNVGYIMYSPEQLHPMDTLLENYVSIILSTADNLNRAGKPDVAIKWLNMPEFSIISESQESDLKLLKMQNEKFSGMLESARLYQQQNTCDKIDFLIEELPEDSEGMEQALEALKTCQVQEIKKTQKTTSQKKPKKSNSKRKKSTGFDWSSINTK